MKVKAFILSAVLSAMALTTNVSAETTTKVSTQATAVTTTTNAVETTVTTAESANKVTTTITNYGGAGSVKVDPEEIGTSDFYEKISSYVGEDGGKHLSENLTDNAIAIDKSTIDYSDKSMYTITTRSGDVFYLIINSSDGSVMFLNNVDTADLISMLNKNNGDSVNSVNENAVGELEKMEEEKVQPETSENPAATEITDSSKGTDWFGNIFMIIGVCVLAIAAAVVFVFIKRKRNKGNSGYDDDYSDVEITYSPMETDRNGENEE